MALRRFSWILALIGILFLISACAQEQEQSLTVPSATPDAGVSTQPTALPAPPNALSICLGDEPTSLFLYGDNSLSARIIRQAIYDGPVDEVDHQIHPVLLDEVPSQENGLVNLTSITIQAGERMIDLDGNSTILSEGVVYLPSGCFTQECAEVYPGEGEVTLDQVVISFPLLTTTKWSDGVPLTAEDSIYAFQVAQQLFPSPPPKKIRLTESYQAVDDHTVQWTGIPGYVGLNEYTDYFFSPLPRHLWGEIAPEILLTADRSRRVPVGWGAYQIDTWELGDHLSLSKNPFYMREDHLSGYDGVVFRFVSDVDEALAAFAARECQIVLNVSGLEEKVKEQEDADLLDHAGVITYRDHVWDQISFGVNSLDPSRKILQNEDVRRAISSCIDREMIAAQNPLVAEVVNSFYQPDDPQVESVPDEITYQPDIAVEILEEVGWMDHDQSVETPRVSQGVEGIRDGVVLALDLLVAGNDEIPSDAAMIRESLATCGIELTVIPLPAAELLAPGPEGGPIFGRKFDLAKFSWTTAGYHPCTLFLSTEIPGSYPDHNKSWGGANAPGYSDPEFDAACREILHTLPDQPEAAKAHQSVYRLLNESLPVLPLYFRQRLILFDSQLEGLGSDGTTPLWNLESIREGKIDT